MNAPHPNITAAAVFVSVAAGAVASPALGGALHTLLGAQADQVQAGATVLAALAAVVAGAGHSMLPNPSASQTPPNEPQTASPEVATPSNPTPPATPEKAANQ